MGTVKRRKFGRTPSDSHMVGATHLIKIGFDKRRIGARARDGKESFHPIPGKLPGFLIFRNTLDVKGNMLIDLEAMSALGATAEGIDRAMRGELKAEDGLLPTTLNFVLPNDARPVEGGGWDFGDLFSEQYECWKAIEVQGPADKTPKKMTLLFCHGDGMNAVRVQPDGTKRLVERELPDGTRLGCVPYGSTDDPAQWCEFSCSKECRIKSNLNLCLFMRDAQGKPKPLSPSLGWSARFRISSSSEYNPIGFIRELTDAADRVRGKLAMLTGTINFQIQKRRNEAGLSPVGQIVIQLDQSELKRREQEIHQWFLEEHGFAAPPKMLDAPSGVASDAQPVELAPLDIDPFDAPSQAADENVQAEAFTDPQEGLVSPEIARARMAASQARDMVRTVAGASDQALMIALDRYLAEACEGDERRYCDMLNDLAFGHPDGHKGKDQKYLRITDTNWFAEGEPGDKDRNRRARLRAACQRLEDNRTPGFFVEEPAIGEGETY